MSDFITITGLEVTTCHGVLASEKVEPQRFIADISFDIDLRRAGESDDLTRSVSYADVAQAAEVILRAAPVDLIETLAALHAAGLDHAAQPQPAIGHRLGRQQIAGRVEIHQVLAEGLRRQQGRDAKPGHHAHHPDQSVPLHPGHWSSSSLRNQFRRARDAASDIHTSPAAVRAKRPSASGSSSGGMGSGVP